MEGTPGNSQGFTFDTLFTHLSSRIDGLKENVTTAMNAADKAVSKAETAAEKRFDSVNEFRNAMKDQQSTFADKTQTDFRLIAIEKRLENMSGTSRGIAITMSAIASAIVTACALITLYVLLRGHA
jgi:anion-transporting  ArsA/GET3 family ATPase